MRSVATAPLILSHWYGSLSLGKTKTISTTCVLQKSQSHQLHFGCLFVAAVQMSGGVCQPLCRKKKKRALWELVGQVWLLSNLWRNGMNASDCWPIVEQSLVSLFKGTLYILCTNISQFFVHEHVSTSKHFSSAQSAHGTHIHCSVDAFPQNSGHASAVWQLHPKGRTNVFTRELFYCERRPYATDCS